MNLKYQMSLNYLKCQMNQMNLNYLKYRLNLKYQMSLMNRLILKCQMNQMSLKCLKYLKFR